MKDRGRTTEISLVLEPSERSRAASPTLRVLFTAEQGVVDRPAIAIARGETILGRDNDDANAIAIDDPKCSREHARLEHAQGELHLVDQGSRNGTFVNAERVSDVKLNDGDLIRIGSTLILVRFDPGPASDLPAGALLGVSSAVRDLRNTIHLVADTTAAVLLLGESGSGKEVAAKEIHRLSGRQGPFVAFNASAIPEALAESQLFGHEAGAFTGASGAHLGYFRSAQGGTLFVDEIGELPLGLQPKLLRALEERKVWPIGAAAPVPFDARIVSATNVRLIDAVSSGRFRGDLYARLNEITIEIAPMRDRKEDILALLASHLDPEAGMLSPQLAEEIVLHHWPFNAREIIKCAGELSVRGRGRKVLDRELVKHRFESAPKLERPRTEEPGRTEDEKRGGVPSKEELEAALRLHRGSIADVARDTGRSRMQVYRWMKQYDLDAVAFRPSKS